MQIKDHWRYTDEEYEKLFETFQLKPGMFSHEAHLRLAYIHVQKYGATQAEINMCSQIKGYAESLGVYDKFNKTVTMASIKVMDHFMKKASTTSFKELLIEFPALLSDFKGILNRHYSYNVFGDKKAKVDYQEPDLLPFEN